MNFMLSIVTDQKLKEKNFYWLRQFGESFRSAGNIAGHLNAKSYDIWICGSDTLDEFEKSVTTGIRELSKSGVIQISSGYFKIGLFLDTSQRIENFEMSYEVLSAISLLKMDLRFCYYTR